MLPLPKELTGPRRADDVSLASRTLIEPQSARSRAQSTGKLFEGQQRRPRDGGTGVNSCWSASRTVLHRRLSAPFLYTPPFYHPPRSVRLFLPHRQEIFWPLSSSVLYQTKGGPLLAARTKSFQTPGKFSSLQNEDFAGQKHTRKGEATIILGCAGGRGGRKGVRGGNAVFSAGH